MATIGLVASAATSSARSSSRPVKSGKSYGNVRGTTRSGGDAGLSSSPRTRRPWSSRSVGLGSMPNSSASDRRSRAYTASASAVRPCRASAISRWAWRSSRHGRLASTSGSTAATRLAPSGGPAAPSCAGAPACERAEASFVPGGGRRSQVDAVDPVQGVAPPQREGPFGRRRVASREQFVRLVGVQPEVVQPGAVAEAVDRLDDPRQPAPEIGDDLVDLLAGRARRLTVPQGGDERVQRDGMAAGE